MARTAIPQDVRNAVLIEAGYRCAVPTCRTLVMLDLHHIEEVQDGGKNDPANLIALCPTCHALYTRGEITKEAINAWKLMLVTLSHTFDQESISNLLYLKVMGDKPAGHRVYMGGDGVAKFSHLIGSGLADAKRIDPARMFLYDVFLTPKGRQIIAAWFSGSRDDVRRALNAFPSDDPPAER